MYYILDLGVKDLVVTSNGEKYKNPKEIKRFEKELRDYKENYQDK